MKERTVEGGCFCGAIRFRARLTGDVAICHCEHCRRATGAPLWACADAYREGFAWISGQPRAYRHESDWPTAITRRFCGTCGTSLTYERDGSDRLDVSLVALDDPEVAPPRYHAYVSSRLSWMEVADDLPRYAEQPPPAAEREQS